MHCTRTFSLTLVLGLGGWLAPHLATQAQSLQLISTTTPTDAQSPVDAVAAPGRLYVADFGASALRIYDTSQPTALKRLGSLTGILRPSRVAASGTKVYLSSRGTGTVSQSYLYAVDASNGAAPAIIRQATTLPPEVALMTASSTLLCAGFTSQLSVFDSNLNPLSTLSTGVDGLVLNNTYLYVLAGNSLSTYDLSVPTAPVKVSNVLVGTYTNTNGLTNLLTISDNYLYINGHKGVFALSNPATPALASANSLTFSKVSGATAYQLSTTANSTVTVVDLRVPTAPAVAATAAGFTNITYSPTDAVTGQDDLVYAVRSDGGQVKTYRYTAGVLSTRGSAAAAFTLYPNPAADEVALRLPAAVGAGQHVAIRNACGQLVRTQPLPAGSTRTILSLAALPAGVYFVQAGGTPPKLVRQ